MLGRSGQSGARLSILGELAPPSRTGSESRDFELLAEQANPTGTSDEAQLPLRRTTDELPLEPDGDRIGRSIAISLLDLEPASPVLMRFAMTHPEALRAGFESLMARYRPKQTTLVIPRAIERASLQMLAGLIARCDRVVRMEGLYPQADAAILRDRLRVDVVVDAGLVAARFGEAARLPVVVVDHVRGSRRWFLVERGVSVTRLVSGVTPERVIAGAVLRGRSVDADATIWEAGEQVIHLVSAVRSDPMACERCGDCVEVCPVNLHPARLLDDVARASEAARDGGAAWERTERELAVCVGCGLCTAVCPSMLPIHGTLLEARSSNVRASDGGDR